MKIYSHLPNITISAALGTKEEMESIVDKLIAASEIHDAKTEKELKRETGEELPPQSSIN